MGGFAFSQSESKPRKRWTRKLRERGKPLRRHFSGRLQGYSLGYRPTQSGSFTYNAIVSTQASLVCLRNSRETAKLQLARPSDAPLGESRPRTATGRSGIPSLY